MRAAAALCLLAASCGGAAHGARGGGDERPFRCEGRHATYVVTGGIAAAEAGVKLSCEGDAPQVEVYRILDGGHEERRSGRISAEAFEATWKDFENGGWRMVEDCKTPGGATAEAPKRGKGKKAAAGPQAKDPFYVFEIADDEKQISVTCKGHDLPYPHDTFRDTLDRASAELPVDETKE
jgi:hypothetical protein